MGPGCPAGFATLKTLALEPVLKAAGVNVFGRPSQKESVVLKVKVPADIYGLDFRVLNPHPLSAPRLPATLPQGLPA